MTKEEKPVKYLELLKWVVVPNVKVEDLPDYVMLGKDAYEELVEDIKDNEIGKGVVLSIFDIAAGPVEVTQNIELLGPNDFALVYRRDKPDDAS